MKNALLDLFVNINIQNKSKYDSTALAVCVDTYLENVEVIKSNRTYLLAYINILKNDEKNLFEELNKNFYDFNFFRNFLLNYQKENIFDFVELEKLFNCKVPTIGTDFLASQYDEV